MAPQIPPSELSVYQQLKGKAVPTRVILDTDIGTDVDDCLALALLFGSPEIALAGIT